MDGETVKLENNAILKYVRESGLLSADDWWLTLILLTLSVTDADWLNFQHVAALDALHVTAYTPSSLHHIQTPVNLVPYYFKIFPLHTLRLQQLQ